MVGIVILDYNNASDTINCIDSVVSHTKGDNYKFVVVENGSKKTTEDEMRNFVERRFADAQVIGEEYSSVKTLPCMTLLLSKTNDGYARGNNKALRLLDKDEEIDAILILNNDILFIEDIINPLYEYLRKLPDCGIVSPLLVTRDGVTIDHSCARKDSTKSQFFYDALFTYKDIAGIISRCWYRRCYLQNNPGLLKEEYFNIELPSGSCMMIDKGLFRQIGYFDEGTFLYFEENILYRKLLAVNKVNYLITGVRCIHLGAATSKKVASLFTVGCQMKSTSYYLRKYRKAPLLAKFVDVMSHVTKLKIRIQSLWR